MATQWEIFQGESQKEKAKKVSCLAECEKLCWKKKEKYHNAHKIVCSLFFHFISKRNGKEEKNKKQIQSMNI